MSETTTPRREFDDYTREQLIAEVKRLRAELWRTGNHLEQEVANREELEKMCDRLAAAIAPADVLGEHSNLNDPWRNALDYAEGQRQWLARREAEMGASS